MDNYQYLKIQARVRIELVTLSNYVFNDEMVIQLSAVSYVVRGIWGLDSVNHGLKSWARKRGQRGRQGTCTRLMGWGGR